MSNRTQAIKIVDVVMKEIAAFVRESGDGDKSDDWSDGFESCVSYIAIQLKNNGALRENAVREVLEIMDPE